MIMRRTKFAEIVLMVIAAIGFLLIRANPDADPVSHGDSRFLAVLASMPHYLRPEELVSAMRSAAPSFSCCCWSARPAGNCCPPWAGRILTASFVFAIVGWLSILPTPPSPAGNPKLMIRWNFLFETFKAIWMATKHPTVFRPLMGMAWFYLATGGLITLIPTLVRDTLGEGADLVALLSVLFVTGVAAGSLACGAFSTARMRLYSPSSVSRHDRLPAGCCLAASPLGNGTGAGWRWYWRPNRACWPASSSPRLPPACTSYRCRPWPSIAPRSTNAPDCWRQAISSMPEARLWAKWGCSP